MSNLTKIFHSHQFLRQRYRIICQVGQGGMGVVYKAEDTQLGNRFVAVKEMTQDGLSVQEIIEATSAFQREAHILAGLQHPNIPSIHDYFIEAGRWYLVMEFIEAETLEEHIAKSTRRRLPVDEVLDIGIQLCTVLSYLHSRRPQIIFRDLKPSNIMQKSDGHIYLIDFGIARHFKPGQAKDTAAFGTLGYAAPELLSKQSTPLSDIYSLGAMFHQMLTGDDPSNTPFRFMPLGMGSSPTLNRFDGLVMRMLDMDENKRPSSMLAIKQELQQISHERTAGIGTQISHQLAATPLKHFPPQPVAPQPSPVKKRAILNRPSLTKQGFSRRSVLIGAVGLAALGAGITWLMRSHSTTSVPTLGTILYVTYRGHSDEVWAVAWSPDGTRIASGSLDKTVQVWNAVTGHKSLTYQGQSEGVWTVAWSPDSNHIASGGDDDATVYIFNATSGQTSLIYHSQRDRLLGGTVDTVMWSINGNLIASGSSDLNGDGDIQIWNAITRQIKYIYRGHSSGVSTLAWSPDGKYIASGDENGIVLVWDVTAGDTIYTYNSQSEVASVAWSPDGKRIVCGLYDSTIHIWDAFTGKNALIYNGHPEIVLSTAWSPNGKYIASGSGDTTVHIWNAFNGHTIFIYTGHTNTVKSVVWSPNGTRIASSSADKTVQVWKAPVLQ